MAGIGDYVHYSYEHFQKYGINQIGDDTGVNGEALAHNVFESQRKQMLAEVRKREQLRNYDIKAIEEQLNFFYGPNQEGLRGDITDEDIKKMHSAIQQYMGDKLSGVDIDYNTLSSAVQEGNMALVEQKMKDKTNTELLKRVQNLGSRGAIGQGSYTTKKVNGLARRVRNGRVQLLMPEGTIEKIIVKNKMVKDLNAKPWKTLHRTNLIGLSALEIVDPNPYIATYKLMVEILEKGQHEAIVHKTIEALAHYLGILPDKITTGEDQMEFESQIFEVFDDYNY